MTSDLIVVERSEFAAAAARRLVVEIGRVLQSQPRCALALSGGVTPRPVYRRLAAQLPDRDPWGRIDLFFADERCVPPDDPESNYRMAKEALLDRVPVAPAQVHRMEGEQSDQDAAARAYETVLPDRLDLLLLGLGEDGHIASLFPDAPALAETRRRVLAVRGPKPPFDRLTVTPPVILAARRTVVLVAGGNKSEALARVIDGPYAPDHLPGQLARGGLWIADSAAARGLGAER